VRIGVFQFCPRFGQVRENLQEVRNALGRKKIDLLVLPELFATGYLFASKADLARFAEPVPAGPTTVGLIGLSEKTGVSIIAGLPERAGKKIYDSAVVISPRGLIGRYRKIHLFDRERLLFAEGDLPLRVFDLGFARIGVIICFDWFFPETVRVLALKGAQIICQCASLVLPWCQEVARARALENRVFFVTANRTGRESRSGRSLKFTGHSQVVSPSADVLLRFSAQEAVLKTIEIDPKEADDKKVTQFNHVTRDRRPRFYSEICAKRSKVRT
jgi:predicted amidohydrolase